MASITEYTGPVCYLGWNFGFIKHGKTKKDNTYFHKAKFISGDFYSLEVDDIVVCDAEVVKNESPLHKSLYRATKVKVISPDLANRCKENESVSDSKSGNESDPTIYQDLFNCKGTISKLNTVFGVIKHNETETVFFTKGNFYSLNEKTVDYIQDVLRIGDLVYYDAVRGPSGGTCEWRATRLWTKPLKTSENLKISKQGKVLSVLETTGLISFGSDAFSERIFFSIEDFYDDEKKVNNLMLVLQENAVVNVEAKTWESECDEEVKCKWIATCVWTGNPPKSDKISSTMCDVEGIITKVHPQRGIFRFINQSREEVEVHFDINDFYDESKKVLNMEWCVKVGDKVYFDAIMDGETKKWKAVVVWKGDKPNYTTIIDKRKVVEQYLERTNPLIKINVRNTSDVPIVTVSSEKSNQIDAGEEENCKNDLQLIEIQESANIDIDSDIKDNNIASGVSLEKEITRKFDDLMKKINFLAERFGFLKDDVMNGAKFTDVSDEIQNDTVENLIGMTQKTQNAIVLDKSDDGFGENCKNNAIENSQESLCSNFEQFIEHLEAIVKCCKNNKATSDNEECNSNGIPVNQKMLVESVRCNENDDDSMERVESRSCTCSKPKSVEVSTQTFFTGVLFCSQVFIEP